jgi:hypothetical protein
MTQAIGPAPCTPPGSPPSTRTTLTNRYSTPDGNAMLGMPYISHIRATAPLVARITSKQKTMVSESSTAYGHVDPGPKLPHPFRVELIDGFAAQLPCKSFFRQTNLFFLELSVPDTWRKCNYCGLYTVCGAYTVEEPALYFMVVFLMLYPCMDTSQLYPCMDTSQLYPCMDTSQLYPCMVTSQLGNFSVFLDQSLCL